MKEKEAEFTSTDFDVYCIHPLDLVFVDLSGFGADVQSWPLGVPISSISGAVAVPARPSAMCLMLIKMEPQVV